KPRATLTCTDAAQVVVRPSVSTSVTRVSTGLCSSEHDSHTKGCSSIQVVTNLSQRRKVLRWLVKPKLSVEANCCSWRLSTSSRQSLRQRRVNIAKVTDWWRKRERYLGAARGTTVVSGRELMVVFASTASVLQVGTAVQVHGSLGCTQYCSTSLIDCGRLI
ncbi:hypothetical protein JG687_00007997, partial [Phytophthora cactorum]